MPLPHWGALDWSGTSVASYREEQHCVSWLRTAPVLLRSFMLMHRPCSTKRMRTMSTMHSTSAVLPVGTTHTMCTRCAVFVLFAGDQHAMLPAKRYREHPHRATVTRARFVTSVLRIGYQRRPPQYLLMFACRTSFSIWKPSQNPFRMRGSAFTEFCLSAKTMTCTLPAQQHVQRQPMRHLTRTVIDAI